MIFSGRVTLIVSFDTIFVWYHLMLHFTGDNDGGGTKSHLRQVLECGGAETKLTNKPQSINTFMQKRTHINTQTYTERQKIHHFFKAMLTKIHDIKINNIWTQISLKPKYSFGKWWKWKNSLMGIVHKSCMNLKALWIVLFETINFRRKLHKTNIIGMPPRILPYRYVHSSL